MQLLEMMLHPDSKLRNKGQSIGKYMYFVLKNEFGDTKDKMTKIDTEITQECNKSIEVISEHSKHVIIIFVIITTVYTICSFNLTNAIMLCRSITT